MLDVIRLELDQKIENVVEPRFLAENRKKKDIKINSIARN